MYLSSVEGPIRRERPLGRWEDRVKEYVSERGVRGMGWGGQGRSVWMRRGGGPSAVATPLWGRFRRERGIGAICWLID